MSDFDFDFSANNEETKIEASIPLGKYIAMIDEVTTNDKGTLVFKFTLIESDNGDTTYQGRKLNDYKSFSEKARKFSLEAIKRMSGSVYGKEIGNKLVFKSLDDYRLTFMNRTVKLSVKHEEFNGDMQAKVGFYMERNADDPYVVANIQARDELLSDPSFQQAKEAVKGSEDQSDVPF
jgi:hypothetical protein